MSEFSKFSQIVAKSFQDLTEGTAFVANVDGDELYTAYLAAFPEGTNPIYRARTEHDCSCCKQFIRRVGNVINIRGSHIKTVWDEAYVLAPYPFNVVAQVMKDRVLGGFNHDFHFVRDLFVVSDREHSFGAAQTCAFEDERAVLWNHLHTGPIRPNSRFALPDTERGHYRTAVQVFDRGLRELTPDAVQTVLSLIEANNLYRGQEFKAGLVAFQVAQEEYLARNSINRHLYVWANAQNAAARFRNTVLGTLVQDLSEGVELEKAVRSYEAKVAPTNYKRTSALITPGMVKKAMDTIESLGLEPALERRFATISDISVKDVKWVDGAVKPLMKGGLREELLKQARGASEAKVGTPEDISLDDFMKVLPEITSLEVLFAGDLVGNLMSLTAPIHPEPKQLFRWSNDFAWSYVGNIADSTIKERVKRAGGKVDNAALRVSLSWFNYDDLDLHIQEPKGWSRIYFGSKRGLTGGVLDVDMNAGAGKTREAVENIVWEKSPPPGTYEVFVHNYAQRETSDPGFTIEIESEGKLTHLTYNKPLRNQSAIAVAKLVIKNGCIEALVHHSDISSETPSQERWGLKTGTFVPVNAVTLSPNYWGDNAVGNKHTFFVLEGAKNDEPTRGFYNEFLHPRLAEHRKVFEMIGDKTKCQPTEGQLSGLGFSSTKKASFVVRAKQGKRQRIYNVKVA